MTLQDAEAVRKMIDGHWNLKMNDETADLWVSVLLAYDAEQATAVVAHMAQRMHYSPKIVDFKEVMRLLHPPAPAADPMPEYKRGVEAPEWVWVWSWARWHRDPREERPFPQQAGHVDETEILTQAEYEELLAEWKEAGSPKDKNPLPVALR
jgi:hypothetical protein